MEEKATTIGHAIGRVGEVPVAENDPRRQARPDASAPGGFEIQQHFAGSIGSLKIAPGVRGLPALTQPGSPTKTSEGCKIVSVFQSKNDT